MAAFNSQAKVGELDSWDTIRAKLIGKTEATAPVDWRARKAERTTQMVQRKKHEAQRTRPPRQHGR